MMSVIIKLLKHPFLAPMAGVAAIVAIIWIVGPKIPLAIFPLTNSRNRYILIAIVVVAWALYQFFIYLRNRRKNKQLAQELAASEKDAATVQTEQQLAELQHNFEHALSELKKARFDNRSGGSSAYLYQLPWYLIIGPPGSGKTTALVNSGLQFPLAKRLGQHKIQGIGGTRDCDWFFTDQAVLVDTAGRYTTQDSEQQVDSAAWEGFLALLKKYRPQRPINGIIVTISLSDLLQFSSTERNQHALAIRSRLQELYEQLGIQFPAYVLFTKADLLAGYSEFFDDLNKEERAQIWGMTFELDHLVADEEPAVNTFTAEFDLLEQRLSQHLLARMQAERDPQRRDLIYTFPQQFNALKTTAQTFLNDIFLPNRFEQRMLLRGAYFTSGTQEGNPIDRMLGALANNFGLARHALPRFSGKGRSYFLTRLFRDVIFEESGLAGTDPKLARKRAWRQRLAYAITLSAIALIGGLGITSYARNQSYVNEVNQQVNELNQTITEHNQAPNSATKDYENPIVALPLLQQARALPGAIPTPTKPSWLDRLGFYQGTKLSASGANTYQRILERAFFPRLIAQLNDQLKQVTAGDTPADPSAYTALAAYLALDPLTYPYPFPNTLSSDTNTDETQAPAIAAFSTWAELNWQQDAELDDKQRSQLQTHLQTLLVNWPLPLPNPLDPNLINAVRARFPERLTAEQLYQELIQAGYGIASFRISQAGGRDAARIFLRQSGELLSSGILGIFRQPGQIVFNDRSIQRLAKLAEGDFVLARPPLSTEETSQLQADLQTLYSQEYCQQWQILLNDIATTPATSLSDAKIKLDLLAGANSPWRQLITAINSETKNLARCLELNQLLVGEPTTPLDSVLEQLGELSIQLDPIIAAREDNNAPDTALVDELLARLQQVPKNAPPPLGRWLSELLDPIPVDLIGGLRKIISDAWRRDALAFCRTAFKNRYPLVATSEQDIPLTDFSKFFGPGGVVDRFLYQSSNNIVGIAINTSKPPWRWNTGVNPGKPGVPQKKLEQLRLATQIKRAYFNGSQQRPQFNFQLTLNDLAGADAIILQLGQQRFRFNRSSSQPLQWPDASGSGESSLSFDSESPILSTSGPWGWFKLLDQAQITALGDNLFRLDWQFDKYQASFELRTANAPNPLSLNIENFRCPQIL